MASFEKLGAFYLGKTIHPQTRERNEAEYLLYDSKDLTTHAICVGMTGSGKTGLCLGLLEEAAIDGVPALIIDPKGDMANLCLAFPKMQASDFAPWIPDEAVDANEIAKTWRDGVAKWGQSPERVNLMKAGADFNVYTPGSTAATPLSITSLFNLPEQEILEDTELLADLISGTASSLLGLLQMNLGQINSREHILISTILKQNWTAGQSVDLASLITQIQKPGFSQVGLMDIESFFPEKDRFQLSLAFNNLLASPSFAAWLEGEALDIQSLLYTKDAKAKHSIISISHLSESERMFFVSLILNKLLAWVRKQSGTSSLRAILYMDEIYGYFPPVANPPSKKPLLTLLKQARAHGLGVVLTTQNPVDLDYKGLANIGTWFIGRLQAQRDKLRLLDGLEGAASASGQSFNRAEMDVILSGLGKRVFLLNNVHEKEPVLFETRWCLSYLRGPMTRAELTQLKELNLISSPRETSVDRPVIGSADQGDRQINLPQGIKAYYLPSRSSSDQLFYKPVLLAYTDIFVNDRRRKLTASQEDYRYARFNSGPIPLEWAESEEIDIVVDDLVEEKEAHIPYADIPQQAYDLKARKKFEKDLVDYLYRNYSLTIYYNRDFKIYSKPEESKQDFLLRLEQSTREQRDEAKEKLSYKYEQKIKRLTERVRKAEQAVQREKQQAKDASMQTMISLGSTVLSSLFGRKKFGASTITKAASTARAGSRAARQQADIGRSKETLETYQQDLEQIEIELEQELEALANKFENIMAEVEEVQIKPLKRDIKLKFLVLAFLPFEDKLGGLEKAW